MFDPTIPIIEKALAKLAGSYQNLYQKLDKATFVWILGSITGASITERSFTKIGGLEAYEIWDELSESFKAGEIILASMKPGLI